MLNLLRKFTQAWKGTHTCLQLYKIIHYIVTQKFEKGKMFFENKNKKDRSERYRTDCLKSIFISDPPNKKHIDAFVMYAGILATPEELAK